MRKPIRKTPNSVLAHGRYQCCHLRKTSNSVLPSGSVSVLPSGNCYCRKVGPRVDQGTDVPPSQRDPGPVSCHSISDDCRQLPTDSAPVLRVNVAIRRRGSPTAMCSCGCVKSLQQAPAVRPVSLKNMESPDPGYPCESKGASATNVNSCPGAGPKLLGLI